MIDKLYMALPVGCGLLAWFYVARFVVATQSPLEGDGVLIIVVHGGIIAFLVSALIASLSAAAFDDFGLRPAAHATLSCDLKGGARAGCTPAVVHGVCVCATPLDNLQGAQ